MATRNNPPGPPCKCHDVPQGWREDGRCTLRGGYWFCSVKKDEGRKSWDAAHPEKCAESSRRWRENNIALGLCQTCGSEPLASTARCVYCLSKQAIQDLGRVRVRI